MASWHLLFRCFVNLYHYLLYLIWRFLSNEVDCRQPKISPNNEEINFKREGTGLLSGQAHPWRLKPPAPGSVLSCPAAVHRNSPAPEGRKTRMRRSDHFATPAREIVTLYVEGSSSFELLTHCSSVPSSQIYTRMILPS